MLTRRSVLQIAAGLVGSTPALAALPAVADPVPRLPPVVVPTPPPSPMPASGAIITARDIMDMYRKYVALDLIDATGDTETWTTVMDTATFIVNHQNGHVSVRADGWEMRVSAGRVPLPVIFFGRPSRAAGYSFLFAATEFLERQPNT